MPVSQSSSRKRPNEKAPGRSSISRSGKRAAALRQAATGTRGAAREDGKSPGCADVEGTRHQVFRTRSGKESSSPVDNDPAWLADEPDRLPRSPGPLHAARNGQLFGELGE